MRGSRAAQRAGSWATSMGIAACGGACSRSRSLLASSQTPAIIETAAAAAPVAPARSTSALVSAASPCRTRGRRWRRPRPPSRTRCRRSTREKEALRRASAASGHGRSARPRTAGNRRAGRHELVLGRDQLELARAGAWVASTSAYMAATACSSVASSRPVLQPVAQKQRGERIAGAVERDRQARRAAEPARLGAVGQDAELVRVADARGWCRPRSAARWRAPRPQPPARRPGSSIGRPASQASSNWLGVTMSAAGTAWSRKNSGMPGRTKKPLPSSPITGSQA